MFLGVDSALLGVDFALFDVDSALLDVDFALLDVDSALLDVDFALLDVDFALLGVDFEERATHPSEWMAPRGVGPPPKVGTGTGEACRAGRRPPIRGVSACPGPPRYTRAVHASPITRFRAWSLSPAADGFWRRVGVGAWVVLIAAVCVFALMKPGKRSVSTVYWTAAQQWWAGQDMYGSKELSHEGYHGFLYFPQAAVLSSPLAFLPLGVAEAAWRAINLFVLAWGFWRLAGLVSRHSFGGAGLWFGLSTLLGIPTLLGSAQNGQFNIIITGLMAHAVVELFHGRHGRTAALLALGIALKPHVIVFALLACALFPKLTPKVALACLAAFAIGFLHPSPAYAWSQHESFILKMRVASRPPPGTNQDLVGLLYTLGMDPPLIFWWALRGLAAIGTLGLCLSAKRAFAHTPSQREGAGGWVPMVPQGRGDANPALLATLAYTLTLAILYIIIFNPRTEGPTYAILSVPVGFFAARELLVPIRAWAIMLTLLAILLGISHELVGPANPWVRPSLAIVFAAYVVSHVLTRRAAIPLERPAPSA